MKHRICFVRVSLVALFSLGAALLPRPALAAFHLMAIDQVIGGVAGDTTAQAVQLRMRLAGQNVLSGTVQLRAWDAAGANPVPLSTFPAPNPTNSAQCAAVLLATTNMAARTSPALTGAYTMAPIPPGYLAAGSLTFENTGGGVIWRVSWGGASYTGSDAVIAGIDPNANDADGHANPPFPGPLPSLSVKGLRFTPGCPALSTRNVDQYAESASNAVLTNNAGTTFTVGLPIPALPYTR